MADLNELNRNQICQHSSWAIQKDQDVCYDDVSSVCCNFLNKKYLRRNINGGFNVFNFVCCLETISIYIFQKLKTGDILCADEDKTSSLATCCNHSFCRVLLLSVIVLLGSCQE